MPDFFVPGRDCGVPSNECCRKAVNNEVKGHAARNVNISVTLQGVSRNQNSPGGRRTMESASDYPQAADVEGSKGVLGA